ncbi:MAG: prenyltransferase/squalene oxidase repeat-containing protein, partial [Candidatus Nanopelagicales bacterium]
MTTFLRGEAKRLAGGIWKWLRQLQVTDTDSYDEGGILDPVDGRVAGEHYSASFFGLLSLILYLDSGYQDYLDALKGALRFHERTAPDEYRPREWGYHWDFNNLAFAVGLKLIRVRIWPTDEQSERTSLIQRLEAALATAKRNRHPTVNWVAMRALTDRLRDSMYWTAVSKLEEEYVLRFQSRDGGFYDLPGSRPIGYHAYTGALMCLLFQESGVSRVGVAAERAAGYLAQFVDPDGCFNYVGRGQGQIFGYAAAIYLLSATGRDELAEQVLRYLVRWEKPAGYFPLMLAPYEDSERVAWYDYHHLTVYNAFLGAWLALVATGELGNRTVLPEPRNHQDPASDKAKDHIIKTSKYMAVFSAGGSRYASEPGGVPYFLNVYGFGPLVSSPGGPVPGEWGDRWGGQEFVYNIFGPLFEGWGLGVTSLAHP